MTRTVIARLFLVSSLMMGAEVTFGQDPPKPPERAPDEPPKIPSTRPNVVSQLIPPGEIKPLPLVAIPDDPPPHEGAMIDIPITVEPPDILVIEVLEALPGRPITGDHLIKPDGTVDLGFYGQVHVRGLTPEQVKVKVILALRKFLSDEVLGLVTANEMAEGDAPPPGVFLDLDNGANGPMILPKREKPPGFLPEVVDPELFKKPEATPGPVRSSKPQAARDVTRPGSRTRVSERMGSGREPRRVRTTSAREPVGQVAPKEVIPPPARVETPAQDAPRVTLTAPAESLRVFVDITAHNSKYYYVQGDVGVPGRLPFTGNETILDAINYAGGFVPTAESADIHLYRPTRGDKPAKDYLIDYQAILKGVASANLQIFPGDRLVVGRNMIVRKTIEIDRAVAPLNSLWNAIFQQALSSRYAGATNIPMQGASPTGVMTPAQQEALIKSQFEFLWSISSREGGELLDEMKFREALMKRLGPPEPTTTAPK